MQGEDPIASFSKTVEAGGSGYLHDSEQRLVIQFQCTLLTLRGSQRQQNDHRMDHKDVHSGCFPTSPAKEHLILGLRLQERKAK